MYGINSFYFHFLIIYVLYEYVINKTFVSLNKHIRKSNNFRIEKIILLSLPIFVLGMFRGNTVGGDLENYLPNFHSMIRLNSVYNIFYISTQEPGYQILTYVIAKTFPYERAFLLITSFTSLIGPTYLIYKYSKIPEYSFFLYYALGFYTNTFNNIRQSLALSICFIAVPAILNGNLRKFIILIFLAITMHYSAIFFSFLYPLLRTRFEIKKIVIILTGSIILYCLFSTSFISGIFQIMAFKYNPDTYIESSDKGWSLLIFYALILFLEILIYLMYHKNGSTKGDKTLGYAICLQTMCCICQMYAPIFASMTRLTSYFYIPIVVIVPTLMCQYKKIRQLIFISYLFISILFMNMTYSKSLDIDSNSQGVIPYVILDHVVY